MNPEIGVVTNLGPMPIGAAFTWRVLFTADGSQGGTPVNTDGRSYSLVVRSALGQTSVLLSSSTSTAANVDGTNDARDFAITAADWAEDVVEQTAEWAVWRTDGTNDRPEAWGTVQLVEVPAP